MLVFTLLKNRLIASHPKKKGRWACHLYLSTIHSRPENFFLFFLGGIFAWYPFADTFICTKYQFSKKIGTRTNKRISHKGYRSTRVKCAQLCYTWFILAGYERLDLDLFFLGHSGADQKTRLVQKSTLYGRCAWYVHMHVCVCVFLRASYHQSICMRVHARMHANTHTHVYICMYVCTDVCTTYACIYVYKWVMYYITCMHF
jgi:hypothetical protein